MAIIGISGKKGHGKDTLAEYIKELTPSYNWQVKKFADALKDMTCVLLKCTREELEDVDFKNSLVLNGTTTPRKIMQTLGTEWGRKLIDDDIWVNSTFVGYKAFDVHFEGPNKEDIVFEGHPNWLITDVRFPNEAKAVKDRGGILIRIERPNVISLDKHPSETALDSYIDWDYRVENNYNLEYLRGLAVHILISSGIYTYENA